MSELLKVWLIANALVFGVALVMTSRNEQDFIPRLVVDAVATLIIAVAIYAVRNWK